MRYPASEKLEIIRTVGASHLPVNTTETPTTGHHSSSSRGETIWNKSRYFDGSFCQEWRALILPFAPRKNF